jgi:hypothetical protein
VKKKRIEDNGMGREKRKKDEDLGGEKKLQRKRDEEKCACLF